MQAKQRRGMKARYSAGWSCSLVILLLAGCATYRAYQKLPPDERQLYRVYSQIMTNKQSKTYLELPTAADRAAYAKQIGVAQQLDALPPQERQAVLLGDVYKGMSDKALRLVWGMPCKEQGPQSDRYWYYWGPAYTLADIGWNCAQRGDTITRVHLIDGHVDWWQEVIPSRTRLPLLP